MKLNVTQSIHGMDCVEVFGATDNNSFLLKYIRSIVSNNFTNSLDYKMKSFVQPFIQGYDENSGWILIEFWGGCVDTRKMYVEYLNHLLSDNDRIENFERMCEDYWDVRDREEAYK